MASTSITTQQHHTRYRVRGLWFRIRVRARVRVGVRARVSFQG